MSEMTKEERKERTRKRVKSAINLENHTYYPEKEKNDYVKSDEYQRVGIYARVSTNDPSQTSSYELQMKYYTEMVARNPNWELVRIYADEGKSGTTIKHREGFQDLMDDAFNGKLDLIIVKNISRFARNVVDFLKTIRILREKKIGVLFESECIYSLNSDSHVALTVQAMVAEQESRIRSRSMETSLRMRLDHGLPLTPELLGFVKDEDGKLRINHETKNIPKLMFNMYLYGYSTQQIADTLILLSKKSYLGNIKWTANGVVSTLRNERYCGDVLTRKRFKLFEPDVEKQRTFKNNGEKPQSYYKDDHDQIISHDDFIAVQRILDNAKYGGASLLPELKVIPEGLFKGFVIVHPKWGSFTYQDYVNASKSVDPVIPEEATEVAVQKGEFDLRNYEVVDFKLFDDIYTPSITISNDYVKFSKSCIEKMRSGNYVELMVHPSKKQLAVRPADKDDRYAIQWAFEKNKEQFPRGVGGKAFIGKIYRIMGWKEDRKYKLYGHIYRDGKTSACIFSDIDSSVYISKEEFLSRSDSDASGQIVNMSGKCIRAVSGDLGHSFGADYYVEKSRRELTYLTKQEWQTRIDGQICAVGDKLNVTPYEELRQFIRQELGDIFDEYEKNSVE